MSSFPHDERAKLWLALALTACGGPSPPFAAPPSITARPMSVAPAERADDCRIDAFSPELYGASADTGCLIDRDCRLTCWSHNQNGELGLGARDEIPDELGAGVRRTRTFDALGPLRAVYVFRSSVCAVGDDRSLWCWGCSWLSRVYTDRCRPTPRRLQLSPLPRRMAGSSNTLCALDEDGTLSCWSLDTLNDGESGPVPPDRQAFMTDVIDVAATTQYFCALDATGAATCWLDEDEPEAWIPSVVPVGRFDRIVGESMDFSGRREDGSVVHWQAGLMANAAAGRTDADERLVDAPPIDALDSSIASYVARTCGLDRAGRLYCWVLDNDQYMCGTPGTPLPPLQASRVPGPPASRLLVRGLIACVRAGQEWACTAGPDREWLSRVWGVGSLDFDLLLMSSTSPRPATH